MAVFLIAGSLTRALAFDISVTNDVDNPDPTGPDQTVEFRVTVKHLGGDSVGTVVIADKLPPELKLPEVMVPYASRGVYDVESGEWSIDGFEEGQVYLVAAHGFGNRNHRGGVGHILG